MIIVVGTFQVDGGGRDRFLDSRRDQVVATLDEPGCIDYCFAADGTDPSKVRLVERWERMADLEAHVAGVQSSGRRPESGVPSRMIDMTIYEATPVEPPWV